MPINFFKVSKSDKSGLNKWPLGRAWHIYPSEDGLVRTVKLLMAYGHFDDHGKCQGLPSYLNRPIHKLVELLTADEVVEKDDFHQETRDVPIEEPRKNA